VPFSSNATPGEAIAISPDIFFRFRILGCAPTA
jgi:hypothetical protein